MTIKWRVCDVCRTRRARYDTPTTFGPWGYLCPVCMEECGIKTSVTTDLWEEEQRALHDGTVGGSVLAD